jgi:hypothetical protein
MKASERLQLREAVKLKTNVLREKRSRLMAMVLSVHRRLQKGRTLLVFCVDNSCHRALAVACESRRHQILSHLVRLQTQRVHR